MHKRLLMHLRFADRVLAVKLGYHCMVEKGDNLFECLDRNEGLIRLAMAYKIHCPWPDVAEVERRYLRHADGRYNKDMATLDLPF